MRGRGLLAALALAAAPSGGHAAPPPPPPTPEALKTPIEGYDLQVPYSRWASFIEGHKGAVVEDLLSGFEKLPGEQPYGTILTARWRGEEVATNLDLRAYCGPRSPPRYMPDLATCHYRFRRAYVPYTAGSYRANPVSSWMRENFDAKAVVAQLRKSGIAPDVNWWRADAETMFATLPSPNPMLKAHARVDIVDSRECPAMEKAILAMEGARLDWTVDILGIAPDRPITPPPPHSSSGTYSLSVRLPGADPSFVKLEGRGEPLEKLVGPIVAAADACKPPRWREP